MNLNSKPLTENVHHCDTVQHYWNGRWLANSITVCHSSVRKWDYDPWKGICLMTTPQSTNNPFAAVSQCRSVSACFCPTSFSVITPPPPPLSAPFSLSLFLSLFLSAIPAAQGANAGEVPCVWSAIQRGPSWPPPALPPSPLSLSLAFWDSVSLAPSICLSTWSCHTHTHTEETLSQKPLLISRVGIDLFLGTSPPWPSG